MVVGMGGVGSWAAECLARCGVGRLILVDQDEVCLSNTNRQLHATDDTIGRSKVGVMAERISSFAPDTFVESIARFYTASSAGNLLKCKPDHVIDAIDSFSHKIRLLLDCRQRGIPIVVSGGAGGLTDPTAIRVVDLRRVSNDSLLAKMRKNLRQRHGFPRVGKGGFRVPAVFSEQLPVFPDARGGVCAQPIRDSGGVRLNCDHGMGTLAAVTGAFGCALAAEVLKKTAVRSNMVIP